MAADAFAQHLAGRLRERGAMAHFSKTETEFEAGCEAYLAATAGTALFSMDECNADLMVELVSEGDCCLLWMDYGTHTLVAHMIKTQPANFASAKLKRVFQEPALRPAAAAAKTKRARVVKKEKQKETAPRWSKRVLERLLERTRAKLRGWAMERKLSGPVTDVVLAQWDYAAVERLVAAHSPVLGKWPVLAPKDESIPLSPDNCVLEFVASKEA